MEYLSKKWDFSDEMKYLNDLKNKLDVSSYDYMFYTNGSIPDTNTMKYFAQQYNIPDEKELVLVDGKWRFIIYNN